MRSQRSHFNPRAPCGARRRCSAYRRDPQGFQPTRPLRGATHKTLINGTAYEVFQPTRPLRGATNELPHPRNHRRISTHAPLAGRDCIAMEHRLEGGQISTHAPLAGRDKLNVRQTRSRNKFQPTRPLRGATIPKATENKANKHFNPRAPCGARHNSFKFW